MSLSQVPLRIQNYPMSAKEINFILSQYSQYDEEENKNQIPKTSIENKDR